MCYNVFMGTTQIQGKGANSRARVATYLPCPPLYAWFYGHVTPPSAQPRRAGVSTVADMPQAAASVFGGKGNNLGVKHFVCFFGLWRVKNVGGSLDLVYMSETRKNFLEVL